MLDHPAESSISANRSKSTPEKLVQAKNSILMVVEYIIHNHLLGPREAYSYLQQWIRFLKTYLNRSLHAEEYIFGTVSPDGFIEPKVPMTPTSAVQLLHDLSVSSRLALTSQMRADRFRYQQQPMALGLQDNVIHQYGAWDSDGTTEWVKSFASIFRKLIVRLFFKDLPPRGKSYCPQQSSSF